MPLKPGSSVTSAATSPSRYKVVAVVHTMQAAKAAPDASVALHQPPPYSRGQEHTVMMLSPPVPRPPPRPLPTRTAHARSRRALTFTDSRDGRAQRHVKLLAPQCKWPG